MEKVLRVTKSQSACSSRSISTSVFALAVQRNRELRRNSPGDMGKVSAGLILALSTTYLGKYG